LLSNSTGANIDIQTQGSTAAGQITVQGYFYTQSSTTGVVTANLQATGVALGSTTSATAAVVVGGNVQFSSNGAFTVNSGAAGANVMFAANSTTYGDVLQTVGSINVTTTLNGAPTGANTALDIIDGAISNINSIRASIGALQNRFTATASNLQTAALNLTNSLSTVQDTDFAKETTALSRAQILQQAGTAMLVQANQQPQQVLALLR
jgi:flagellin